MTTWNKQTSTVLARKPVAEKSSEKLQTTKLNCRNSFCLKSIVSGIGIMLKFRLLRFPDIFWNHASWSQEEEILRSTSSTSTSSSTSALDSLVVEVSESRLFSSNCVRLALVVFCPLASLARLVLVSSSSLNHSSWLQCYPRCWTCGFHQIFASSVWVSSKTKIGKKVSCVLVLAYV